MLNVEQVVCIYVTAYFHFLFVTYFDLFTMFVMQNTAFLEWAFLSRGGDRCSGAGGVQRWTSFVQRRTLGLQSACHSTGQRQAGGQDLSAHW